ncbi:NAD(P)-binding protein, partial [uncultured Desulfovibrio sp.]|uniref:NAD(P)-binding protein n=1 Tax=uncultured Desulfovibrio sp. TaxID=167968 RepID=UPI0026350E37
MALEKMRGRRIQIGELAVVVGAGRSGRAAARLLSREGARVRLLDRNAAALSPDQTAALRKLGVDVRLGEHSPEQFE